MTDNANEGSEVPRTSIASNNHLSRTVEFVSDELAMECEKFDRQMELFKADPRRISNMFKDILIGLDMAQYFPQKLKTCSTQLRDFARFVSALHREFEGFPLDVKQLHEYSELIDEYVENEWPPDGPGPGLHEDELNHYEYEMKRILPLLFTWAKSQAAQKGIVPVASESFIAKSEEPAVEQPVAEQPVAEVPVAVETVAVETVAVETVAVETVARNDLTSFAKRGGDVPVRFREGGKADGKEIGPLKGTVAELTWKIAGEWTSSSQRLLRKHQSHNYFVIKLSKGNFEVFFHRPEDLKVAMARDPRPDSNPKKRSRRSSVK